MHFVQIETYGVQQYPQISPPFWSIGMKVCIRYMVYNIYNMMHTYTISRVCMHACIHCLDYFCHCLYSLVKTAFSVDMYA